MDHADHRHTGLIPAHGGYRKLKSFQVARLVYDVTVRFCDRYIAKKDRTHDQMVQAARSGVQNIAEGSVASATSRKMELKLTNVAKASLEELRLDYEDFLRRNRLPLWDRHDRRRHQLVALRCTSADQVAGWVRETAAGQAQLYPELAANGALVLIGVAISLLDRQIKSLAARFQEEGGFTERLYHQRTRYRASKKPR